MYSQKLRINEQIRTPQVRLIDENGEQIGILDTRRALLIARERKLDLVELVPQSRPPVCKILDFGKYQYQKQKREQKAKRKQKKRGIKGIRLSLRIGKHDLEFKARQADQFLEKGHKVKIELILKGREHTHLDLAFAEMEKFRTLLEKEVRLEQKPQKRGDRITMILAKD